MKSKGLMMTIDGYKTINLRIITLLLKYWLSLKSHLNLFQLQINLCFH